MTLRVLVEVDFDDTELSVSQEIPLVHASSSHSSRIAVRTMGTAVGKMLVALGAGSNTPPEVLMAGFYDAVVRASRIAVPRCEVNSEPFPTLRKSKTTTSDSAHTCDGVGCC